MAPNNEAVDSPSVPGRLRECAEAQLVQILEKEALSGLEESRAFIRELRIHQIELETQNEELREARQELQATRDQLMELYDYAPVAYLIIAPKGRIIKANVTAATMLGVPRPVLAVSRLYTFIAPEDRQTYFQQRQDMVASGNPSACHVRIIREEGRCFEARMQSIPQFDDSGCLINFRTVIMEITE